MSRATDTDWRANALSLGVDPDEPDDYKYFDALARAEKLIASFQYHQPSPEQIGRIANIRRGAIEFVKVILCNTWSSDDQTVALRKVHEAMMDSNKSIVNEGFVPTGWAKV